jgi:hypothetical protein
MMNESVYYYYILYISLFAYQNVNIVAKLAYFMKDLPYMLPTMLRFIWLSGFRGEDILEINQSETRIACGGHVCKRIGTK